MTRRICQGMTTSKVEEDLKIMVIRGKESQKVWHKQLLCEGGFLGNLHNSDSSKYLFWKYSSSFIEKYITTVYALQYGLHAIPVCDEVEERGGALAKVCVTTLVGQKEWARDVWAVCAHRESLCSRFFFSPSGLAPFPSSPTPTGPHFVRTTCGE